MKEKRLNVSNVRLMKRRGTVHGLIEDFVRPQLGRLDSFRDKIKKKIMLNENRMLLPYK